MKWNTKTYLDKITFYTGHIDDVINIDLYNIIVIPCYNETNLSSTIKSLYSCLSSSKPAEIIVVINSGKNEEISILEQNTRSVAEIKELKAMLSSNNLRLNYILVDNLPLKHAGVGLARKIGMDEAVFMFNQLKEQSGKNISGIITCLDADCTVEQNYLIAIENHFLQHASCPGISIKYAHELSDECSDIALYELHLRYYNQALLFAGFPFAFHTVGSSMAVRALDYQKQGGMNKRKAGEDFYFLHKFIKLEGFAHISSTCVYPSSRESNRVPFGTGRAMINMKDKPFRTYSFGCFQELKEFVDTIPKFIQNRRSMNEEINSLPPRILEYLGGTMTLSEKIKEIYSQTSDLHSFRKRFFEFIDAFWVMKFLNWRRLEDGGGDIVDEAIHLYTQIAQVKYKLKDPVEILTKYRLLKRE